MTIKIDTKGAEAKIKTAKKLPKAVRYQFNKWGSRFKVYLVRAISGRILKTRTGFLRRNISYKITETATSQKMQIGTGIPPTKRVKYARILEKGGQIKAKRVKYLTIPFPGVKGRARNFPDTFVLRSKKGNLIIAERRGATGFRPLFLLKPSVMIPEFKWFSIPLKEKTPLLKQYMRKKELLKVAEKVS